MNQKLHQNHASVAFAEVIESSLQTFTAQTWQWDNPPHFGSIMSVQSGDKTLFGVVYDVKTGTLDGHRQPFAYQKTEEELKKEQPQIFEFLITTFSCLVLGHQERDSITYQWAPEPPKIHAFVSPASPVAMATLLAHDQYLHLIFNATAILPNSDELILALFKEQVTHKLLSKERQHQLLDTFSLLTGNDYRRLKLFLQRADFLHSAQ